MSETTNPFGGNRSGSDFIFSLDARIAKFDLRVEKNKEWTSGGTFSELQGKLVGFKFYSFENEKKKKTQWKLKLWLATQGKMASVSCNWNSAARSIINTIAAEDQPFGKNVQIALGLYSFIHPTEGEVNSTNTYIKVGGQKTGWLITGQEMNELRGRPERVMDMVEKHILPKLAAYNEAGGHSPAMEELMADDEGTIIPYTTEEKAQMEVPAAKAADDDDLPF
ncbi:MAG: hypothetical protein KDA17_00080 [Candidatus Saccharibacteria bacterium]|nr:hypothetical protein [Candidatus Saccharibacteria bacterium]